MAFFEDWQARQVQERDALRAQLEQLRAMWVGRRVWFQHAGWGRRYGEVHSIGDDGQVVLLYSYDHQNRPLYLSWSVEVLGQFITLAAE
jgi:hypothetical protein